MFFKPCVRTEINVCVGKHVLERVQEYFCFHALVLKNVIFQLYFFSCTQLLKVVFPIFWYFHMNCGWYICCQEFNYCTYKKHEQPIWTFLIESYSVSCVKHSKINIFPTWMVNQFLSVAYQIEREMGLPRWSGGVSC